MDDPSLQRPPGLPDPTQPQQLMVNPMGMALPEQTDRTETQGPETTTHIPTPGAVQAAQDLDAAGKREAEAQTHVGEGKVLELQSEAQGNDWQRQLEEQKQAEVEAARAANARKVAGLTAETEKRRQEMEAKSKITDYWEDKGTPAKIASAFLVGLSEFSRIRRGGGSNTALEIFNQAEAADKQKKLDAFTRSEKFHAIAKGNEAEARALLADKLLQIDQDHITRGNILKNQIATLAARSKVPGAQAEAEKLAADIDAKNAEKRAQIEQHYDTAVNSGRTTTSHTDNTNKSGAKGPNQQERTAQTTAEAGVDNMTRLREIIQKHPEAWKEWQKALGEQRRVDALGKSADVGKAVGAVDIALDQRLTTKEGREINSLMAPLITAKAREMDPVGALNEGTFNKAEEKLGLMTRPPDEMVSQVQLYEDRYRRQLQAAPPPAAAAAPQAAPPRAAASRTGGKRAPVETRVISGVTYQRIGDRWKREAQ